MIIHGREVIHYPASNGVAEVYSAQCFCGRRFTLLVELFTAESRCVCCENGIDLSAYTPKAEPETRKPQRVTFDDDTESDEYEQDELF